MRNLDLSTLNRSFIGLDHLASLADNASRQQKQPSYPPYNIESLSDDQYRITMVVAGFDEGELAIESQQNALVVKGVKAGKAKPTPDKQYLYQGISNRNFERKFQLGDFVKVNDASIENGLLHIELLREVPEALKPRKIDINNKGQLIDNPTSQLAV